MIDQRVSEGRKVKFFWTRPAFTTTIPAQLNKKILVARSSANSYREKI